MFLVYLFFLGTSMVWNYLRSDWAQLVERFTLNDRYFARMPKYATADFASQFELDELKAFFEKYPEEGAGTLNILIVKI